MSRPDILQCALYEPEVAWNEATSTYANRVPIIEKVVPALTQEKIEAGRVVQYRNERTMGIRGVKGGEFSYKCYLTGHGSSTSGATAATTLGSLMGNVIGNIAVAAASGTTLTGSTDADTWATTASGTYASGSVGFLGAAGDGAGEGQAYEIATHITTAMEVKNAAAGAPVNTAVLYSAENIYPSESPASALVSSRHRLLTANQQYDMKGCYPKSIAYDVPFGGAPTVSMTFGVSDWAETSNTFPASTSVDTFSAAPVAGGSLFYQTYGTSTRNVITTVRSLRLTHTLGIEPQPGPGGTSEFQLYNGAVRTPDMFMVEWTEDAQTASATPTRPAEWDSDTVYKHLMFTFSNAASGKRVALRIRKFCLAGRRPVQSSDGNINRYVVSGYACTDTAGTNDLTRAAYVWALG